MLQKSSPLVSKPYGFGKSVYVIGKKKDGICVALLKRFL